MEQRKENRWLLVKKEILAKIAANTRTQLRFVQRREMVGLRRLLKEREALIGKLAEVDQKLAAQGEPVVVAALAAQEREILKLSRQVLAQAVNERERIAAELRESKQRRQAQNQYRNCWLMAVPGMRLNARG